MPHQHVHVHCCSVHSQRPAVPAPPQTSIWETEVLVNTPLGRLQIITPLLGRAAAYNVVAGAPGRRVGGKHGCIFAYWLAEEQQDRVRGVSAFSVCCL